MWKGKVQKQNNYGLFKDTILSISLPSPYHIVSESFYWGQREVISAAWFMCMLLAPVSLKMLSLFELKWTPDLLQRETQKFPIISSHSEQGGIKTLRQWI